MASIYVDELLIGVLATACRRYIDNGPLKQLEQPLLHTLSTYIASNGGIITFARDFVYLINEYDPTLCCFFVVVARLQKTSEDTFNIFPYITGFGKYGSICNGKGYV